MLRGGRKKETLFKAFLPQLSPTIFTTVEGDFCFLSARTENVAPLLDHPRGRRLVESRSPCQLSSEELCFHRAGWPARSGSPPLRLKRWRRCSARHKSDVDAEESQRGREARDSEGR
ncbi:hypothetical protein AAFF_G00140720 [Aldrovandia affinis]|uniref:Uncharacterized protein n=1 Tax=Aldrovandia affinis TaxID=143900 RepID=A0AAD7X311_9TELE|nr:hypothetical protein AAFF_G00140720 [Aldrovandia affinis]